MRYGSVCSGIEAASVAWHGPPLGWEPAWFAEVDPFASAVLAHRFPGVENRGDFTQVRGEPGSIDVLVGGTPCQSFSVAGRRAGLDDPRGVLAIEFLRLAGRLRPRWLVFENVPGFLSSGGGRDFGTFLGFLGQLGYGWAYRVLDAKFFGVPQRRRRLFVVGHLGDWRRAVAVLFERHCLSGDPPAGREAEPDAAPSVTPGARRASGARAGEQLTVARCLASGNERLDGTVETFVADGVAQAVRSGPGKRVDSDCTDTLVVASTLTKGADRAGEKGYAGRRREDDTNLVVGCLNSGGNSGGFRTEPGEHLVAGTLDCGTGERRGAGQNPGTLIAYQQHGSNVGPMGTVRTGHNEAGGVPFIVNAAESNAVEVHARESDVARCLDGDGSFASNQGGTVVAHPYNIVGLGQQGSNHAYPTEVSGCLQHRGLSASGNQAGTVFAIAETGKRTGASSVDRKAGDGIAEPGAPMFTLGADSRHGLGSQAGVRRLTPLECERLQGLPDEWTLVPVRLVRKPSPKALAKWAAKGLLRYVDGHPCLLAPDGPRYRAVGNSMAVPVVRWLGMRIQAVDSLIRIS